MSSIDLSGKKGVVFGVANQRSIAWSIANALAGSGAELAFTYLGERLKGGVEKTISALGDPLLLECDVTDDAQAMERAGHRVHVVLNEQPNPKITTTADWEYVEHLLKSNP